MDDEDYFYALDGLDLVMLAIAVFALPLPALVMLIDLVMGLQ